MKVSEKLGSLTSTAPLAWPATSTGPLGSPCSTPRISMSTMWLPSRAPSTRNSALPGALGIELVDVVRRARLPVRTGRQNRLNGCRPPPSWRAKRVVVLGLTGYERRITGDVPDDPVATGRQEDLRLHILDHRAESRSAPRCRPPAAR